MSACPFFPSTKPIKQPFSNIPKPSSSDPSPFAIERKYEEPYFSPYSSQFIKYDLIASKPLHSLDFLMKNTIFHHCYVTRFRTKDLISRVLIANELRESGNRNYNKGQYLKACMCYEHAFGLFNYCVDADNIIKTHIEKPPDDDLNTYKGIITQVLVNYTYALIALGNFQQAKILLTQSKNIDYNKHVKAAEIVNVLSNIESEFKDIIIFSSFIQELKNNDKKYSKLDKSFNFTLYRIQQEKCEFWGKFFNEYSNEARTKPLSNFELEFSVVQSLNEKYEKMMEFYKETENFEKVDDERKSVHKVLVEMKKVKKVKINDKDDIMLAHAKSAGIVLDGHAAKVRFEAAKRSLISKIFNQGSFNKRLLYECIQVAMVEFEQKVESKDQTDLELQFWHRNLVACVVFAIIAFLMSASPFKII